MAYDEQLAVRIRKLLKGRRTLVEKKMFGGLAFLLNGKMFAGILKKGLVVRVGPKDHDAALEDAHTRPMDFTGRPMRGYVYVSPAGTKDAARLQKWIARGLDCVAKPVTVKNTTRRPK